MSTTLCAHKSIYFPVDLNGVPPPELYLHENLLQLGSRIGVKSRQVRLVSAIIAENGEVLWHSAATPQMLFIWGQHDDT